MDVGWLPDTVRGELLDSSYDTRVGLAVPCATALIIAAALAGVHRYVIDPPEDSKRKRVPKRRHVIMSPQNWHDRRQLHAVPRAFECWIKLRPESNGGVIVGSIDTLMSPSRGINLEVDDEGHPKLVWRTLDFEYEWVADSDLRTGEWTHLAFTFGSNGALDMLLCFVDGAEVDHDSPEQALPNVVPELPMLVGRDHSYRVDNALDGEVAHVRVWSCMLPDEVIEAHVDGTNRIYPELTEADKTKAATDLQERRLDAQLSHFHQRWLLGTLRLTWPDRISLTRAPRSVDAWVNLAADSEGGVICSSVPGANGIVMQVERGSGFPRLIWYSEDARPTFDLTLEVDARGSNGDWVHVAFAYSESTDTVSGFVRGVRCGEGRRIRNSGAGPPGVPATPVHFAKESPESLEQNRWLDGMVSHVRFWASELMPHGVSVHAEGKTVYGAHAVTRDEMRAAAEQAEQRREALSERVDQARAEAEAAAARAKESAELQQRRTEEIARLAKRQAADAQIKVMSYMSSGKKIDFSESISPLKLGQAFLVDNDAHAKANNDVLAGLAQILTREEFAHVKLEVHAKTSTFGSGDPARNRQLQALAKAFNLDPKTQVKAAAEELAKRRATSTRDALVKLGIPEDRLALKWTGLSHTSEVLFTPKPMDAAAVASGEAMET
mmetsp:Transcript_22514/g.66356  ORF Transcript_22514/g.66356 Transcript_22514/m.66356 type:complete len:666 (+) Transcript_22514:85-2082(+)